MIRPLLSFLLVVLLGSASPALASREEAAAAYKEGTQQLMWGEFATARATLTKATKADPDWAPPYTALAMAMLELGDGTGAELQINHAGKLGVKPPASLHLLAFALVLQDKQNEALTLLERGKIDPKYKAYAARVRGIIYDRMGNVDAAGAAYDEAVNADGTIRGLWGDVASFRYRRGDVAGAIDAAVIEAKNAPRSVRAMMIMGDLIRGRYGLIAALPWFRRAVQIEPANIDALGELAATLGDAGQTLEMLTVTRRMIAADPNNARAFYLQSVMAARAGKYDLARNLMYRTKGRMDEVPAAILLNAALEIHAASHESAIARLEKLSGMQPDNFKAKRLLGLAMLKAGDAHGAASVLASIADRGDADSYTLLLMARALEAQGDIAKAAPYLDHAQASAPAGSEPFNINGDMMRIARASNGPVDNAWQAVPYINKQLLDGNLPAAVAHARRMAELNPGSPAAQILAGDALAFAGQHGPAIEAYRRAADLRFDATVALRMIETLNVMGARAEALKVLDYYLSQNPRSVPALRIAAEHLLDNGQWDRSIAILTGLDTRLGGHDAEIARALAWAWFSKGNSAKALAYAREAYRLLPGNADTASTLGWIKYKSRDHRAGSFALLKKASLIRPEDPEIHFLLGQAFKDQKLKAAARRHLGFAANAPHYANAAKAKALLAKL